MFGCFTLGAALALHCAVLGQDTRSCKVLSSLVSQAFLGGATINDLSLGNAASDRSFSYGWFEK